MVNKFTSIYLHINKQVSKYDVYKSDISFSYKAYLQQGRGNSTTEIDRQTMNPWIFNTLKGKADKHLNYWTDFPKKSKQVTYLSFLPCKQFPRVYKKAENSTQMAVGF